MCVSAASSDRSVSQRAFYAIGTTYWSPHFFTPAMNVVWYKTKPPTACIDKWWNWVISVVTDCVTVCYCLSAGAADDAKTAQQLQPGLALAFLRTGWVERFIWSLQNIHVANQAGCQGVVIDGALKITYIRQNPICTIWYSVYTIM